MNKETQENWQNAIRCIELMAEYFENNEEKITIWLETDNPGICMTPKKMIEIGKADTLLRFIKDSLEGNMP